MKLQPPNVLLDLFRDLRDRRLLPVVILLAVGIVAVPIALGGSKTVAPPPVVGSSGTNPGDTGAAAAGQPVVLAEVPGLREFQKRLDAFRERDPFRQQLAGPTEAALNELDVSSSTATDTGSTSTSSGTATLTTPDTTSSGTTATSTGTTSSATTSSTGQSSTVKYVTVAIDVKVGPVGDTISKKNVPLFSFLPKEKRPIVQFVSGDTGGKSAAFTLSPSVSAVEGGRCRPDRGNCDYLLLKQGEDAYLTYGPDARRYRLKLIDVHVETVDPSNVPDPRKGN